MHLAKIYDNPTTTTNNYAELARRAKVTEAQAKHFLKEASRESNRSNQKET